MSYQPFAASYSNVTSVGFPWGMPNYFSTQGVETEETRPSGVNVDNVEDQEPEYKGPPITFQIPATPAQSFLNNIALQYVHSGAPLGPNMQPRGDFLKRALQLPRF